MEYLLWRRGPMAMAPSQLGAFTRSSADLEWPDLEYHVQPLSLDAFGEPLHTFDAFTSSVCNLNPTSRGHVHIRSSRHDDAPVIAPNYLSTDHDRAIAAQSLRLTRRIVGQAALAPYRPEEFRPGVQYQTDDELARLSGESLLGLELAYGPDGWRLVTASPAPDLTRGGEPLIDALDLALMAEGGVQEREAVAV